MKKITYVRLSKLYAIISLDYEVFYGIVEVIFKLIEMLYVWSLLIIFLMYVYRAIRLGFFILKETFHKKNRSSDIDDLSFLDLS